MIGAPLPAHTRGQRARDRAADPVGDPAQPSAPADDGERARGQDDMDALAPEIASLVEPFLLGPRLPDLDDRAHEGALRRRAPRRKVEPCSLARALAIEAQHAHGHANLERASPARAGHIEQRGAARPISERSSLWSRASRRTLPHHRPATRSAAARARTRIRRSPRAQAASATATAPKNEDDA